MKKWITCTIMAVMMAAMIFMGTGNCVFAEDEVTYDSNMQTKKFDVDVKVGEDGSYTVTENIKVKFVNPRHGIYRYIPYKGNVTTYDENGKEKKLLYYADFDLISNHSNTDVDEDSDGNSQVLKFGDEDYTVSKGNYKFTYKLTPKYQGDTYDYLYYNIFPTLWRNKILAGSTFTIRFPKKTDVSKIRFSYGTYGQSKDAGNLLSLKYDKNQITGTLKKTLPFKNGMTCYASLGNGYFTQRTEIGVHRFVLGMTIAIFVVVGVLFIFFGRDEKIIPSIQYQPPQDMDSAVVGYVVDGSVDDQDVISLILYWADKGYLKMKEKGKDDMLFIKLCDIPKEEPRYQRRMFKALFKKKDKVKASSLKYKFADTVGIVKMILNMNMAKRFIRHRQKWQGSYHWY